MNTPHTDPNVVAMSKERPMRHDLQELPLHPDPDTATAQLLMRQAVPLPLSEELPIVRSLKKILSRLLHWQ